MAGVSTIHGGGGGHHPPHHRHGHGRDDDGQSQQHIFRPNVQIALRPAEYLAAQSALAKLSNASSAVSTHARLLTGLGQDTFAGGISSVVHRIAGMASDTVVGGSVARSAAFVHSSAVPLHLGSDTISLAGATATTVKALDTTHNIGGTHSVTLADNTVLNVTGVATHHFTSGNHHN